MNLEEMGKAVAETLALKGKIISVSEDVSSRESDIGRNEKEIERLSTLEKVTEKAKVELEGKRKELAGLDAQLQKRLDILKKEGIVLPVGANPSAKQVSL
jgi:hypothetical protein